MFDPFQSSPFPAVRRPVVVDREASRDHTIYYSTVSDSDSSGAEHRFPKSATSSRVGKYQPPHRKSGAASPTSTNDLGISVKPGVGTSSSPPSSTSSSSPPSSSSIFMSSSYPPRTPSDGEFGIPLEMFGHHDPIILQSLMGDLNLTTPSSPATSASGSTVTTKQSDKQCYVYFRTGHCAKGAMCPYKHEEVAPPTSTVKHFDPRSHPSYRTKPCYPFIYGQCSKGDECTFKHEIPSQQVLTTMTPAATEPVTAGAPEYRTKECKWFNSPGGCWYGDSCKFKHSTTGAPTAAPSKPSHLPVSGGVSLSSISTKVDMENIPVNAQPPLSRARVCAMYLRGACPNGDLCNYSHPPLSPESPTSPRTLVSPQSTGRLSAAQETFPLDVAFASFLPRHAQTLPSPITPQRHSHHAFSLPLYSSASRSPNNSLDIPITPTMTSSFSSATSSSVSASPTSSLMASPPEAFYNRRYSETHDEEVEAVLGGRGMKYGAIGTGIPSYTNEPVSLVHEIYTYDDDDDDEVIVYMPHASPAHPMHA